jgi:hypothetical protein
VVVSSQRGALQLLHRLAAHDERLPVAMAIGLPGLFHDTRVCALEAFFFPSGRIEFLRLTVNDTRTDDDLIGHLESMGFGMSKRSGRLREWIYEHSG